ncbi:MULTISPECIES: adenine phosphoribosyltransferase [Peptoniphilus]|uniref:Adenine phosphoribosyltransferase n=2 Tax=Peptoniphilus lacrimalis TaxID=33031 RepID=D1VU54_9FIRM|nr:MULTISPECIES: adenine phosphoribosyltransferase [Peptoniphilus]KGF29490.1 adenine phosphoribosyltransferase [Peptoniphilus lacrimalis DNF00528]EFA89935.1 adenine phosphoribosyltransferase [Peptoniphilus lacrimalis 315-B]EFK38805.1 adenine phosphoribosyltransferase [Peptoniphilus sp. oral taxon 836 str. F0141]MDK8281850.1 adenine phosphoribosyltransferase [Peptoniphilus lacrimalis]SUB57760.1 Adenine phosphoribosyltransferase [Peptoniphilus lacrimalis]
MSLKDKVRAIPDYPKKGVIFRDVTTLLKEGQDFKEAIDKMAEKIDYEIDKVIGIEARGFIVGAPLAYKLSKGFIPIRKPGKLPCEKISVEYDLEYGTDSIEMHVDGIKKGEKVVIVDDLLATGGTSQAAIKLVESLGAEVAGLLFLMELDDINGRQKLKNYRVDSIIHY